MDNSSGCGESKSSPWRGGTLTGQDRMPNTLAVTNCGRIKFKKSECGQIRPRVEQHGPCCNCHGDYEKAKIPLGKGADACSRLRVRNIWRNCSARALDGGRSTVQPDEGAGGSNASSAGKRPNGHHQADDARPIPWPGSRPVDRPRFVQDAFASCGNPAVALDRGRRPTTLA